MPRFELEMTASEAAVLPVTPHPNVPVTLPALVVRSACLLAAAHMPYLADRVVRTIGIEPTQRAAALFAEMAPNLGMSGIEPKLLTFCPQRGGVEIEL